MSNSEIKEFKVKKLPKNLQPSSLYYVKVEPDKFKIYLTDSKCPPTAYSLDSGGSVKIITSSDGSIQIVETATETQIQIEASLLAKINSALQSGDNISELVNDVGYLTISDVPPFDPSNYDLEEFNNNGADPYAHQSEITSGITNLSYTASPTQGTVNSDTGSDAIIPLADTTNSGLLKPAKYIVLENTSNVNSGDQTSIVGITGTKAQFNTSVTDGDILYVGDITQYTDEQAQDAVGTILLDTTTIDLSYTDGTPSISADVKPNSIDATHLSNSINVSEFVNDSGFITDNVVDSVFGRTGSIIAQGGDYTTALVTETTNKNYQTDNQKLYNDATSSIQTQLNTKIEKATIAQIRAYSGSISTVYTTDLNQQGNWYYDASDTTSADNTGTILVTTDGKRIKRIFYDSANIQWFGAVGDGTTDNTTFIQSAIATGKKIFIPEGTFITSNITLLTNSSISGLGEKSILKFKTGSTGYMLNGDLVGGINLDKVALYGADDIEYQTVASIGTRSGIYLNTNLPKSKITNCKIYGFNAIGAGYNGTVTSKDNKSLDINNCNFLSNYCAISTAPSGVNHYTTVSGGAGGEYSNIIGSSFYLNRYAVVASAGNTNVTGNVISNNGYGIYTTSVSNVGHGNIVSNLINHSTVSSIEMVDNIISHVISGNSIYSGNIVFTNCTGIIFSSNQISVTGITITGAGFHNFADNFYFLDPVFSGGFTNCLFSNNFSKTLNEFVNNDSFVGKITSGFIPRANSVGRFVNANIYDDGSNIGVGTINPIGKLTIATGTDPTTSISAQVSGTVSMSNNGTGVAVPVLSGKSDTSVGMYLIGATADIHAGSTDFQINVRETDNTDFTTLTSSAFKFSRFSTTLVDILRNGNTSFTGNISAGSFKRTGGLSTQALLADGSVLSNPLSGNGVNGRIGFFSSSNNITSDNGLVWDNSSKRLGVNTTLPVSDLDIRNANGGFFFDGSNITYNRIKSFGSTAPTGKNLLISAQSSGTTPDVYIHTSGGISMGNTTDLGAGTLNVTGNVRTVPAVNANDAVVKSQLDLKADIASPTFTGNPTAPTPTAGDNDTSIATTAFVTTADNLKANIASPTFTTGITTPAVNVSGQTASTIALFDASKNIVSASTGTYPSLTELSYIKGVTSSIQTQINAVSRPYKSYCIKLTQTGTSAPTVTYTLENTVGTITWTRNSTGTYYATSSSLFVGPSKCSVSAFFGSFQASGEKILGYNADANTCVISTTASNGTVTDGLLSNAFIEIRVYN